MAIEKGRGATLNGDSHRFNLPQREADGDWLDTVEHLDGPVPRRRTQVTIEHPRTILTRNASPDIGFSQSINAYRGCEQHHTVARQQARRCKMSSRDLASAT